MSLFEEYRALGLDYEWISLGYTKDREPYFCYPKNSTPIGYENGGIMYCFIKGYGETVFAANPESCVDINVYPLAHSFKDFLGLILACGSANPPEQVIWMSREQFDRHLKDSLDGRYPEQEYVLQQLRDKLGITPIDNPYDYVKAVQKDFDYSKIKFRKERTPKVQFEEVRIGFVTRNRDD